MITITDELDDGVDTNVEYKDLRFNRLETCHECPFVGNIPGWLGGHESAQDFVDNAKKDWAYPCLTDPAHQCVGQALFMNKDCKRSLDWQMAAFQDQLRREPPDVQVLHPAAEMLRVHGEKS